MPETGKGSEKRFLGGVAVLLPATLFAKILGLFYKIPLVHTVGVVGMAYFLSAYHVYSLLFVLAASGLPAALSLLISRAVASGDGGSVGRIVRLALFLFLVPGLGGSLALYGGADLLAARLSMPKAAEALRAISPSLLLSVCTGTLRGWFQGHHNMIPTAVSEVLEAMGKLCFGLLFARLAVQRGALPQEIAAAAVFGITAGIALSAVWLFCALVLFPHRGQGRATRLGRGYVLGELGRIALPITVSGAVMNLVSLIDTVLISARLQMGGLAAEEANALYSCYGNLAVPFYNLVPALLAPVSMALIPTLSTALAERARGEVERVLASALRVGALVALPASLGLATFAHPLLSMLYRGQEEAVAVAAPLLAMLAASMIPAVLISLTGAALQATGHTAVPLLSMLAGAGIKLTVELMLLPLASVGIKGAPISTLCCNLAVLGIQLAVLGRVLPVSPAVVRGPTRALRAAISAVGGSLPLYAFLGRWTAIAAFRMPLTLLFCAALYALLALRWRAVTDADVLSLPAGDRLLKLLYKYKLLREVQHDERRKTQPDAG